MPLPKDTVALPLVKGVDLTTDARLLQAPALLEAVNTQFYGGGAKKRKGHSEVTVRGEGQLTPLGEIRPFDEEDTRYWTRNEAEADALYGVFSRDSETVAWDGLKLYSYLPSQITAQDPRASVVEPAVLPSLRSGVMAKFTEHQSQPELADTGTTKIVAWISDTEARYAIYDSETDTLMAQGTLESDADYLRAFSLGDWMHVLVRNSDTDTVNLHSVYALATDEITTRSYGPATHFDLWKSTDSLAVLARTNSDGIDITWITPDGSGSDTRDPLQYVPGVGGTNRTLVSITHDVTRATLGVAWYSTGTPRIGTAVLDDQTGLLFEDVIATNVTGTVRLTLTTKSSSTSNNVSLFDLYWDNGTDLRQIRFWYTLSDLIYGTQRVRFHLRIASRAFNFQDRSYLWVGYNSDVQSTWFLLDEGLKPVGHQDFGVGAVSDLGSNGRVSGINWTTEEGPEFHSALAFKLRVAPNDSALATAAIYTEPSIKGTYLNFLPPLRTAQAGRATYIAGAQVWSYDGRELVEAGFHLGPEPELSQTAGGSLTDDGVYSYRVDLCHRNAQNEEVRSLSLLTDGETIDAGSGNQTILLTIPTVLTRRDDSYFLIYRNAQEDGVPLVSWWLLNSRDPESADFLLNDLSVTSVTFEDDGSVDDIEIQTRELHPATDTYLQPISAPACEIIASGRDRLWVGGGELPPGVVAPSRLFDPAEIPSFNPYLNIQVDRSAERFTGLGFVGEVAVFFRKGATHLLDSDGPDNVAQGLWNPPRLAFSDLGALSQESILRTSQGIIFQSAAGFRVVGPGGALTPLVEMDKASQDFEVVGAMLSEKDQEVRFYGEDRVFVFNYLYGTWATWTCGGIGVTTLPSGYAVVARSDGKLWLETPGLWQDGPHSYTHRIRTAWLHGGNLGDFQRVRWVGALGRFADLSQPEHTLRLQLYYDEREFWEERIEWTLPDSVTNQDSWGAGTWGAGVWGDTSAEISNLEDLTWEWERRPARQKCSVVSISLEDVDSGPGFELAAFTLELARKSGLNRTPAHSGSDTYR